MGRERGRNAQMGHRADGSRRSRRWVAQKMGRCRKMGRAEWVVAGEWVAQNGSLPENGSRRLGLQRVANGEGDSEMGRERRRGRQMGSRRRRSRRRGETVE
ncbi:hypothetical protein Adt_44149 [Abeliophyllum distichum]|uniref:Uncharacterized protein n=1 Tax=Abeliophyllum distichum TaxID=126358 RepID=A0ABD1PA27_9LAMI